jgi:hypothetical protein
MVKQSFVSHRICVGPTTNGISSPHPIGRHSTRDADLGGSNPLPLEGSGGGPPLILALGKDRKAATTWAGSGANSPWRLCPSGPSSPPQ